jgi:ArsR family transcriptional regulator, arsenate/arsenite/antimonite-responsive transcriptional repressor
VNKHELVAFAEDFGKGIGHKSRFAILTMLSGGPRTVTEISEHLKASQSTTSQHLSVLKHSHLIESEKRGQFVYYTLNLDYMLSGLKGLVETLEAKK